MNAHEVVTQNQWTGAEEVSIGYDNIYNTSVGDMADFAITEIPPGKI